MTAAQKIAPPAITPVLWRSADEKGFPALWLAGTDQEPGYCLMWKVGRRWNLTGHRDDVLASVSNEHFEAAATAIRSRS